MNRTRTCIGCRKARPKGDLLRIARAKDGAVAVDLAGKGPGRGAYVCSAACLDAATASGALAKALRARVADEVCTRLRDEARGRFGEAQQQGSEE